VTSTSLAIPSSTLSSVTPAGAATNTVVAAVKDDAGVGLDVGLGVGVRVGLGVGVRVGARVSAFVGAGSATTYERCPNFGNVAIDYRL